MSFIVLPSLQLKIFVNVWRNKITNDVSLGSSHEDSISPGPVNNHNQYHEM